LVADFIDFPTLLLFARPPEAYYFINLIQSLLKVAQAIF